jgi:hypothetical protein
MSNPAQVIILAEDARQSRLTRAWIRARVPAFPRNNIRESEMAWGKGSGSQQVLRQYEVEVKAYLSRHARKWLIVVIDADNLSVQERLDQLTRELRKSEHDNVRNFRPDAEQVARLVPKWSVETWILSLNGENVDENTRYKNANRDWGELIRPAALTLSEWTARTSFPADCIPSLTGGIGQLRRLTLED